MSVRLVILFIPIIATGSFLRLWLPKSMASALSVFIWMLLVYWIPSRPNISLGWWLVVTSVAAGAVFLLIQVFWH